MGDTIARLHTLQGMLEFVLAMIPVWVDESPGGDVVDWLLGICDDLAAAAGALDELRGTWLEVVTDE